MADKQRNYNLTDRGRELLRTYARITRPHLYTRGPITREGKARSRFNGLKHGRFSKTAKLKRECDGLAKRYKTVQDPDVAAEILRLLTAKLEELRVWQLAIGDAPRPLRGEPSLHAMPVQDDDPLPVALVQSSVQWQEWLTVDDAAKALSWSTTKVRRWARRLASHGLAICANRNFPYWGAVAWYIHVSADPLLRLKSGLKKPSAGHKTTSD